MPDRSRLSFGSHGLFHWAALRCLTGRRQEAIGRFTPALFESKGGEAHHQEAWQ